MEYNNVKANHTSTSCDDFLRLTLEGFGFVSIAHIHYCKHYCKQRLPLIFYTEIYAQLLEMWINDLKLGVRTVSFVGVGSENLHIHAGQKPREREREVETGK